MNLITFSTLFPNAAQPAHGLFVEGRLRELRQRQGVQASVVAPVPWFPFKSDAFGQYGRFASAPKFESRDGVDVWHPRYALPPKVGMHIAPRTIAAGARRAVAACKDKLERPVLDAHYFYPDGVAAAHLAERLNLPLIITARGSDINLLPRNEAVRQRMLWAGERASALVAVSQALALQMVAIGLPASKIQVHRNGVDLAHFVVRDRETERRALGLGGPVVLSVGNLYQLKGHDLAIEAVAAHPGVTLVIAGAGPELVSLKGLARALKVDERVHFVGSVSHSELVRYYNAADMLVLASSREGMANVLLETLACGTPAVVTPVGGNPEVISTPAAGIVLEERSVAALVAGIGSMLSSPPSRDETRRYAESFSWADVTRDLYQLFDDVREARVVQGMKTAD